MSNVSGAGAFEFQVREDHAQLEPGKIGIEVSEAPSLLDIEIEAVQEMPGPDEGNIFKNLQKAVVKDIDHPDISNEAFEALGFTDDQIHDRFMEIRPNITHTSQEITREDPNKANSPIRAETYTTGFDNEFKCLKLQVKRKIVYKNPDTGVEKTIERVYWHKTAGIVSSPLSKRVSGKFNVINLVTHGKQNALLLAGLTGKMLSTALCENYKLESSSPSYFKNKKRKATVDKLIQQLRKNSTLSTKHYGLGGDVVPSQLQGIAKPVKFSEVTVGDLKLEVSYDASLLQEPEKISSLRKLEQTAEKTSKWVKCNALGKGVTTASEKHLDDAKKMKIVGDPEFETLPKLDDMSADELEKHLLEAQQEGEEEEDDDIEIFPALRSPLQYRKRVHEKNTQHLIDFSKINDPLKEPWLNKRSRTEKVKGSLFDKDKQFNKLLQKEQEKFQACRDKFSNDMATQDEKTYLKNAIPELKDLRERIVKMENLLEKMELCDEQMDVLNANISFSHVLNSMNNKSPESWYSLLKNLYVQLPDNRRDTMNLAEVKAEIEKMPSPPEAAKDEWLAAIKNAQDHILNKPKDWDKELQDVKNQLALYAPITGSLDAELRQLEQHPRLNPPLMRC